MRKMKSLLVVFCVGISMQAWGGSEGNYSVTINGKQYDVDLGRDYTTKGSGSGEKITFRVDKKKIATYETDFLSFRHNSDLGVNATDLGGGLRQIVMTSALGTVVMFQEYSTLNPDSLLDFMLDQVTKEEVAAGLNLVKKQVSKTLPDGTRINGLNGTLSGNGEEKYYNVYGYGKNKRGILFMTIYEKENVKKDQEMIDLLWSSLKLKL